MLKNKSIIIALVFLLTIYFPIYSKICQISLKDAIGENRRLAELPAFEFRSMDSFPHQFEAYFNDHFGLRAILIRIHRWYTINLFIKSPSKKVIFGKMGWMYYKPTVDQHRSGKLLDKKGLARWQDYLTDRYQLLSDKGIPYFFFHCTQ